MYTVLWAPCIRTCICFNLSCMQTYTPLYNGSQVILGEVHIWCLGSSILKHAFTVASTRPGSVTLGLDWAELWWQGYSGMALLDIIPKLKALKQVGDEPAVILLHCGGNDFGRIPVGRMRMLLDSILVYIKEQFHATIVWSEVLPRSCWRHSDDNNAMELVRRRFNNYAAHKIVQGGGFFVKHADLQECTPALYKKDGVHLNFLGNCIFLNQLASALDAFHQGRGSYYK